MRRLILGLAAVFTLSTAPAPAGQLPIEPLGAQLRIASPGPAGSPDYDVSEPDIAYNSRRDEFLVVWSGQDQRWPGEIGIYGQRLDGRGRLLGQVLRLSSLGSISPYREAVPPATHPAIAYDPDHDRYGLVYSYPTVESPLTEGQRVAFQLLDWDGARKRFRPGLGEPTDAVAEGLPTQPTEPDYEPDIAYNADVETFFAVWRGKQGSPDASEASVILGILLDAEGDPAREQDVRPTPLSRACQTPLVDQESDRPCDGAVEQAFEPAVVAQTGTSGYLVAWVQAGRLGAPGRIYGLLYQAIDAVPFPPVYEAGTHARDPALSDAADRALLTYTETPPSGPRTVHATIIEPAPNYLDPSGQPLRLNGGAVGAEGSSVAYMASHNAFLVAWNGTDDGTPAAAEGEREVTGQVVDFRGREIGRNDFLVSDMGSPGSTEAGTGGDPPVIAGNPKTGEWLVAWAGEEDRAPSVPGKFELWGRRVGPNTDRDHDGAAVPGDCNDLHPGVHPGAHDKPLNGIDEDCSGADSRDRDGDGFEPPADCDDGNRFVRPGRREVSGNQVDEDCDGSALLVQTQARVRAAWLFGRTSTTLVRLSVQGARRGMTVRTSCRGGGCPASLRARASKMKVRRRGVLRLTRLLAGARLAPGARVEVRVTQPGTIGVAERFVIRAGSPPRQTTRCLVPGRRAPVRCR